jgi:hypothetical protein
MVRIILLLNVSAQHDSYYVIVERMWTTWSVLYYCRAYMHNIIRIILLLNECGQHDLYYIIVERL